MTAIPSPNIWEDPDGYELENRGVDPDGAIEAAMLQVLGRGGETPLADLDLLDIGCGSGYHLPRFASMGANVVGVEPHPPLLARARARVAELRDPAARARIDVREGGAQALPLPDRSVDVAHARWAYFFGAGCEPGLAELDRVMRPGSTAFVIDNDATRSTFGGWFARAWPSYDALAVERFWHRHGWSAQRVDMRWAHATRSDLEQVVRLEFAPEAADRILAAHDGTEVDYAVNLWHRSW